LKNLNNHFQRRETRGRDCAEIFIYLLISQREQENSFRPHRGNRPVAGEKNDKTIDKTILALPQERNMNIVF